MSTMIPAKAYEKALVSPIQSLLVVFGLWKTIVLVAALCSPGPGYDSSGVLYQPDVADSGVLEKIAAHVGSRLSSWDAIYFTEIAKNGYYHEQFYMAGYGWTSLISYFSSGLCFALLHPHHHIHLLPVLSLRPLYTISFLTSSQIFVLLQHLPMHPMLRP